MNRKIVIFMIVFGFAASGFFAGLMAQKPYRVGTTTANFLEIGYGSAGIAMGDAYVSATRDLSSVYWNPAGLSYMERSEALFNYQPWIADINTSLVSVGLVFPQLGTFAATLIHVGYGDMKVTNLEMQDGTGELFTASDLAFSVSYARRLAQWFAFGASGKVVNSKIWHTSATAYALDLGVLVNTYFFSTTGDREDGMTIGMSISNYGTRMKFDGMDLMFPIDILPEKEGNYRDVPGKFETQAWELPLIFRIGVAVYPIKTDLHQLTLAADALHPNNNSESINFGAEYKFTLPTTGDFFLRIGYKGMYMDDNQYGPTFGAGMNLRMMGNVGLRFGYAFRDIGVLGGTHSYSIGVIF